MSKEDIIKAIELIDEQLQKNHEVGAVYIPTTRLLMDVRKMYVDMLKYKYGVFYT